MLRHALTALTGGRLSVARAVQPAAAWGRAGGGASGGAPAGARGITTEERDKIVEQINDMFIEARDEIEMAVESKDTVYFNEEAEIAIKATEECLALYKDLIEKLEPDERGVVQRSMGMKMEQLRAELETSLHSEE
mmetsp:Transcript_11617/g.36784  ORF Transcript_11617/g.36784 Transcript_11617/m.36784 type:complete len:136 (+) Transcript_11617:480-887(+)